MIVPGGNGNGSDPFGGIPKSLRPTQADLMMAAHSLHQQGLFDQAAADFSIVIARDPKNVRALSLRGAAYARMGENE